MRQRLGRAAGALTIAGTVAAATVAASQVQSGHRLLGATVAVALLWGCAGPLAVWIAPRRARHPDSPTSEIHPGEATGRGTPGGPEQALPTVTTIVKVGDEPAEIARSSVALARRAGPTIIISRRDDLADEMTTDADSVHTAGTVEAALLSAVRSVTTDAVLVISARAVPEAGACRRAAALLDDRTGWVTGTTLPFNRDRFSSDRREVVGAHLRSCAALAGADLWENDATLVRTDLLTRHALTPGRPWGAWLRARAAEGYRGARTDAALSLRAAPVAAASYWPDALARQRAGVLDLAGATTTGPLRGRLLATLLVARELFAYPLIVWLLMPALLHGGAAFDVDPWLAVSALGVLAVLRWWSLRAALGVEPMPGADLTAAWYHAPGSLAAPAALLRRRIGPARRATPTRPLVWAGMILTVIAADGVLRQTPGEPTSRVAVAVSLALLGLLWAFTIRAIVERNWSRTSYRVRLDLPAWVGDAAGRTVDGSPGGLAVRGRFPAATHPIGTEVVVRVDLDDDTTIESPGVIAARRRNQRADLLGLEIHPGTTALDQWSAQLLRASAAPCTDRPTTVAHETGPRPGRGAQLVDRILMALVVVSSVAAIGALVLVLLGFRPLVVRSGSMVPTYEVGDVVLVGQVRADELREGDVASLEHFPDVGEGLTHRVREVRTADGTTEVETRGDANSSSENWAVSSDTMVGRVVASVRGIGVPATLARTATAPLLIGVALVTVVVVLVLRGVAVRPAQRPSAERHGADSSGRASRVP